MNAYEEIRTSLAAIQADPDFVDLNRELQVRLDLRYASSNNLLGRNLYGPMRTCYVHRSVISRLAIAAENLETLRPGFRLLIFDCLRPRSVQRILWYAVQGTEKEKYVVDPEQGSIHNFGFAVDLSLADASGRELDMGTPFDFFGEFAEPRHESRFLSEGKFTPEQVANRRLLRDLMLDAGFLSDADEWWHFDALDPQVVRAQYKIVE